MHGTVDNRALFEEIDFLDKLIEERCGNISKPFTLKEICQQIESNDYSAEMLLQHLLLWVSARCTDLMELEKEHTDLKERLFQAEMDVALSSGSEPR